MADLDQSKGVEPNQADKVKIKKNLKDKSEILSDETKVKPDTENLIDVDVDNLIKLSPEKRNAIENMLYREIQETIQKDSGVRSKCQENHEMYEGVPDKTAVETGEKGFDLDQGDGIRSHYGTVAVQGKVHRYIQSMFGLAPWITVNLFGKDRQDVSSKIQDWLQLTLEKFVKLKKKARMIATNTGIEDVGISSLTWERRTEPEIGIESYDNLSDFQKEYPSAKEAGISDKQYQSYIKALTPKTSLLDNVKGMLGMQTPNVEPALNGAQGEALQTPIVKSVKPISIKYKKNKIVYDFCCVDVVNRSKFGLIPYNATFDKARGKFIELDMTWNDLAKGLSEGRYENIDRVKSRANSNYVPETEEVEQAQASNEGKGTENEGNETYKTAQYKGYRVLYSYDIDNDGLEELCIFTFMYSQKVLIRAEYWDKNWYLTPHYIEEKSNRFEGIGIIAKERNVIKEADAYINLRLRAGKLSVTPSFKAKKGSSFDPGLQYFYPGVIWWLDNMDEVEQWQINVNLPYGFNEEASLERKHELLTGMTAGLSGRELPQDPNAPGNKTALLMREGSVLINGDIDVFRDSIEQLVYNILTMADKYLPEDDKYLKIYGLTKMDLKLAKEEISLYGTSLAHNPEMRKQEELVFYNTFMMNPIVQQSVDSMRSITADTMDVFGKDSEKLLPTEKQLFDRQVMVQMEAMKRLQEEIKRKNDEDAFRRNLTDMGLSPDRAEARLKEWKNIEASQNSPINEEAKEEIKSEVPI